MDLNPRQQEAVDYGFGPLLIAAGAGSGKTKTLTSRLIKLIESGVKPETIAAITFTNKAAQEMRDRIANAIQKLVISNSKLESDNKPVTNYQYPFIGTFHSLGARFLKHEAKLLGRTPAFTIFDSDDSLSLIKKMLKALHQSREDYSPVELAGQFSKVKSLLLDPEGALEGDELRFYETYERALLENNAFDFDDLIQKVVALFRKNLGVLEKYQNRLKYILVDEYQDVNPAQYEFVKLLALKHKNLSVVGDDAQAIYGWRYADFRNFLNFEKDWPEAKIVTLEENYRSAGNIIRAASELIKNNKLQRPKNLWTKNPSGDLIKVIAALDAEKEAGFIAQQIANRTAQIANRNGERLALGDLHFAVLYRTNAQSRALEAALIQNQIPYQIFGGVKFYERKEIKDIVAILRLASNPKDKLSAERLAKTFSKQTHENLIGKLPSLKNSSILEIINFAIGATNYFGYLERNFKNARERIENVNELIAFAGEFTNLAEFLERVALFQSTDIPANRTAQIANRDQGRLALSNSLFAVNLMTIHMAKGLEFDNVFIAGANEGLLPHQMSYGSKNELEEERRLMYVAMTRAKKNLWLSFYNLPSRFVYELPPELTEFINLTGDSKELPDAEEIYID